MDKQFHCPLYNGCNYLWMLWLKLNHFSTRGPRNLWICWRNPDITTPTPSKTQLCLFYGVYYRSSFNTLRLRQNGYHLQTTYSDAFSGIERCIFVCKFHWSLFLRCQLTLSHHWFRQWLNAKQATSCYLNQWWLSLMMHICVTRPRWVNKCREAASYFLILITTKCHNALRCW